MVVEAVLNIKDFSRGASRQAISNFVTAKFNASNAASLRTALRKLTKSGTLLRTGLRYKIDKDNRKALRQSAKKKSTKKKTTKKKKTTQTKAKPKKKSSKKNSVKKTAAKKKTTKKKTTKKKTTKKKTTNKKTTIKKTSAKKPATKKSTTKKAVSKAPVEAQEAPAPALLRQASSFTPIIADAVLYKADDGTVFEANLAQIDLATNTDKFYKLQVLKAGAHYHCGQHWGRTGTAGEKTTSPAGTLEAAISVFEDKFKEKAGASFSDRETYTPAAGKYRYKKKDYNFVQKGKVMWQYYVDDHVDGKRTDWYNYVQEASDNVEGVYQEWKNNRTWLDIRCVQSGHFSYRVDFNNNTQENNSTHKKRAIHRTVDGKVSLN